MGAFSTGISKASEAIIGDVNTFFRKTVFEIYNGIVIKSPVDTGRFKGNWNISSGAVNYTYNDSATSSPYGEPANIDISSAILRLDISKPAFISNGLPYSGRLETGYSKQAPSGMVDVTVVEYQARIAKLIGKSL